MSVMVWFYLETVEGRLAKDLKMAAQKWKSHAIFAGQKTTENLETVICLNVKRYVDYSSLLTVLFIKPCRVYFLSPRAQSRDQLPVAWILGWIEYSVLSPTQHVLF